MEANSTPIDGGNESPRHSEASFYASEIYESEFEEEGETTITRKSSLSSPTKADDQDVVLGSDDKAMAIEESESIQRLNTPRRSLPFLSKLPSVSEKEYFNLESKEDSMQDRDSDAETNASSNPTRKESQPDEGLPHEISPQTNQSESQLLSPSSISELHEEVSVSREEALDDKHSGILKKDASVHVDAAGTTEVKDASLEGEIVEADDKNLTDSTSAAVIIGDGNLAKVEGISMSKSNTASEQTNEHVEKRMQFKMDENVEEGSKPPICRHQTPRFVETKEDNATRSSVGKGNHHQSKDAMEDHSSTTLAPIFPTKHPPTRNLPHKSSASRSPSKVSSGSTYDEYQLPPRKPEVFKQKGTKSPTKPIKAQPPARGPSNIQMHLEKATEEQRRWLFFNMFRHGQTLDKYEEFVPKEIALANSTLLPMKNQGVHKEAVPPGERQRMTKAYSGGRGRKLLNGHTVQHGQQWIEPKPHDSALSTYDSILDKYCKTVTSPTIQRQIYKARETDLSPQQAYVLQQRVEREWRRGNGNSFGGVSSSYTTAIVPLPPTKSASRRPSRPHTSNRRENVNKK